MLDPAGLGLASRHRFLVSAEGGTAKRTARRLRDEEEVTKDEWQGEAWWWWWWWWWWSSGMSGERSVCAREARCGYLCSSWSWIGRKPRGMRV
ncbi:hypothetical protein PENSPDRAFT_369942 [Peniophora sp. CONT]|nr:hypothetical protein PENSPDRAFT_369942 [Peniophora sp. CONT]